MLENVHPGEILLEEFLKEFGISQNRLGREIGMSPRAINEIVHGKRSYDLEEVAKEVDLGNVSEFDAA
jgi:addiction module HigA family antidote